MDTLKVRVQASKLKRNASIRILKTVSASQLYQGFKTATVSAAVFGGLYIMFYERCREFLEIRRQYRQQQQQQQRIAVASNQSSRQSYISDMKTTSRINCIVQHSKHFINKHIDGLLAAPNAFLTSKWADPALSCLFANTVTSWIEVPIDTIKQRMQAAGSPLRRPLSRMGANRTKSSAWCSAKGAISSIRPSLGISGLYRAYWPFLLRTLPFEIIEFSVFESLKQATKKYKMFEAKKYEGAVYLSIGACAGATAAIVTMPIDNMKTRINVLGEGFFESFMTILRNYGVKGFFRGVTPRLATHVPSGALYFAIYAISKTSLRTKLNVQDDRSERGLPGSGIGIKPKPPVGLCEDNVY